MSTSTPLDRASAVPLYYQLQEQLRQEIESGLWNPGDSLPTEHDLCRRHEVSRACVRQALGILQADGAILRRRGVGTFVAPSRLGSGVPGLVRSLLSPRNDAPSIRVLDYRTGSAEASVCRILGVAPQEILRLTTMWAHGAIAYAIGVTFLRASDVAWLLPARDADGILTAPTPSPGVMLGPAEVSIETTTCGRFEAERLSMPVDATLMVTVSVHHDATDGRPYEISRIGYRGDRVQLRFRGTPLITSQAAAWAFDAPDPAGGTARQLPKASRP